MEKTKLKQGKSDNDDDLLIDLTSMSIIAALRLNIDIFINLSSLLLLAMNGQSKLH